jgi:ABC-type transport system involved in cytochrome c biogenesis permease subunit
MITWDNFYVFVLLISICWGLASFLALVKNQSILFFRMLVGLQFSGILILSVFIIGLSYRLQRPPMQTMGEIRLWYVLFLSIVGIVTYLRWRYRWILLFTTIMSIVFMCLNIVKPELHNQNLMPALQSVWFVPHVIIYMFSYSLLGCSFIIALVGLIKQNFSYLKACDNIVNTGLSLFFIAMLIGAVWAKEAWGHYWTWDAKEIWAAITSLMYLLYLHFRTFQHKRHLISYLLLIFAFFALQMCWYGVNYFPSLRESLHSYV